MLWIDNRPRRERAAQLMFFAVANQYCIANNLDVSPETNAGGGPVDFKFSKGFNERVLVEIKMSTGTVEHGYAKQLEIYKKASDTSLAYFVVIDIGKAFQKVRKIERIRDQTISRGERASIIMVVDAKRKTSASKV